MDNHYQKMVEYLNVANLMICGYQARYAQQRDQRALSKNYCLMAIGSLLLKAAANEVVRWLSVNRALI